MELGGRIYHLSHIAHPSAGAVARKTHLTAPTAHAQITAPTAHVRKANLATSTAHAAESACRSADGACASNADGTRAKRVSQRRRRTHGRRILKRQQKCVSTYSSFANPRMTLVSPSSPIARVMAAFDSLAPKKQCLRVQQTRPSCRRADRGLETPKTWS